MKYLVLKMGILCDFRSCNYKLKQLTFLKKL